jgi:uncharacterized membrane protein YeaQ/YmgE (transglycosylase-associated protein family)
MTITVDADLIALIIIGFVAGSTAAMLFERRRDSNAMWVRNIIIGVIGAFIGAFLFDQLGLRDDIPGILMGEITPADILVAFVGAAVLMLIAAVIRR